MDTYFTIQEPNLNPLSIVFIPGINNRNGTLKRNRDVFHKETYLWEDLNHDHNDAIFSSSVWASITFYFLEPSSRDNVIIVFVIEVYKSNTDFDYPKVSDVLDLATND